MVYTSPNRWLCCHELGYVAVCDATHLSNKGCVELSDKGGVEPSDEACHDDVIHPPSHMPSVWTERVLKEQAATKAFTSPEDASLATGPVAKRVVKDERRGE